MVAAFHLFKASSPLIVEAVDADIWYCLYEWHHCPRPAVLPQVRGGPQQLTQRSDAEFRFENAMHTRLQKGGGGSVAAAAAAAAARLSFCECFRTAIEEFAVFHGESEAGNEVFQRGFGGD